ncbi:MAG: hypothetical protein C4310_05910 [Chloroflexota bacterium]
MHLTVAQKILAEPGLDAELRELLTRQAGPFYFGNTAPDVQVVSGQPREATHFSALPPTDPRPSYEVMFAAYPALARPEAMPEARAAFLAGYIAHLLLDDLWMQRIFYPYFGRNATWGQDLRERLVLHNILRTHLDFEDLPALNNGTGRLLQSARPYRWLPFTEDRYLVLWRDEIAAQLAPGAPVRTVEVFARRMGIPTEEFAALLAPEVIAERIFSRLAPEQLAAFRQEGLERSIALIGEYLKR